MLSPEQEFRKKVLENFAEGGRAKHLTNDLVSHASEIEPNYPEGTKVKLVHFDPATGIFTEGPIEVIQGRE